MTQTLDSGPILDHSAYELKRATADIAWPPVVAAMYGITVNDLEWLCEAGQIPHRRAGRLYLFSRAALADWVPDLKIPTKKCGRCRKSLVASAFGRAAQAKDGRSNRCRQCTANHARTTRARWVRRREVVRGVKQRRQQNLRVAAGRATDAQIDARVAYYGGQCWMCGAPWEHIDHVIPISKGGTGWPANLRPACQRCNLRKAARRVPLTPGPRRPLP